MGQGVIGQTLQPESLGLNLALPLAIYVTLTCFLTFVCLRFLTYKMREDNSTCLIQLLEI